MRLFISTLILLAPLPCLLSAQSWEVGAAEATDCISNKSVTSGSLTGSAGFDSGFAAGALLGNQMNSLCGRRSSLHLPQGRSEGFVRIDQSDRRRAVARHSLRCADPRG